MSENKTKWTPGPWCNVGNGEIAPAVDREGRYTICSTRWTAWSDERQEANARLIARAPEMVELLRKIVHDELALDMRFDEVHALKAEIEKLLKELEG